MRYATIEVALCAMRQWRINDNGLRYALCDSGEIDDNDKTVE